MARETGCPQRPSWCSVPPRASRTTAASWPSTPGAGSGSRHSSAAGRPAIRPATPSARCAAPRQATATTTATTWWSRSAPTAGGPSRPSSPWARPSAAPADGIYHGAAMSAVVDGTSVHVVYKDQNQMRIWYRRFDAATGTFGARVQIDDSAQDWALQPATTLRDGELFVLANHRLSEARYETRMWRLSSGFGAAQATALPPDDAFHGYPALPETVPAWVRTLPYVHARAPTAAGAGEEVAVRIALDPPAAVLSLEAGRAILPAGKAVAVRVDTAPMSGLAGS